MPTVSTYDMTGKQTGTMELNEEIFGVKPNGTVMHSVVVNYLAISARAPSPPSPLS